MGKRRKKHRRRPFVLAVVSIVFVIASLFLTIILYPPLFVQEYEINFIVAENRIGFDLNNAILTFGVVLRGSYAEREIFLINNYPFPIKVNSFVSENIDDLIDVDSGFVINQGQEYTLPVKVIIPEDFKLGNYTGKMRLEMHKQR